MNVFSAGSSSAACAQLVECLAGRKTDVDGYELGGHDAACGVALVLHQLLDILGLFLFHLLQDAGGLFRRQFLEHVGGVIGLHGRDHVRHPFFFDRLQQLGLLLRFELLDDVGHRVVV